MFQPLSCQSVVDELSAGLLEGTEGVEGRRAGAEGRGMRWVDDDGKVVELAGLEVGEGDGDVPTNNSSEIVYRAEKKFILEQ